MYFIICGWENSGKEIFLSGLLTHFNKPEKCKFVLCSNFISFSGAVAKIIREKAGSKITTIFIRSLDRQEIISPKTVIFEGRRQEFTFMLVNSLDGVLGGAPSRKLLKSLAWRLALEINKNKQE